MKGECEECPGIAAVANICEELEKKVDPLVYYRWTTRKKMFARFKKRFPGKKLHQN